MSYELELLDCNCNECIHMERDFKKFKKWESYWRIHDEKEFQKKKLDEIRIAESKPDPKGREHMLKKANALQFQFDKSQLTIYGRCKKFCRDVSFRPTNFQLETQHCFDHRRKLKYGSI